MESNNIVVEHWCYGIDLQQWNGVWLTQQRIQAVQETFTWFKPHPTDVVLCSFPKTGTTWLKALLFSIINRRHYSHSLDSTHPHELVPSLEFQMYQPGKTQSPTAYFPLECCRRIFHTHMPYPLLAPCSFDSSDDDACKVVYVTRNPKDTLVSFWHFTNKFKGSDEDPYLLETAVSQFCEGTVPYGPYYEHMLGYWKESVERPNKVFFVTYEGLKDETTFHVKRLAQFLGCPFEDNETGENDAKGVADQCSFEVLSNKVVNKSVETPDWSPVSYNSFFRKGLVHDYRNYLSPEMIGQIDAVTRWKFHELGFMYGI